MLPSHGVWIFILIEIIDIVLLNHIKTSWFHWYEIADFNFNHMPPFIGKPKPERFCVYFVKILSIHYPNAESLYQNKDLISEI